jgi:hypothetical protein
MSEVHSQLKSVSKENLSRRRIREYDWDKGFKLRSMYRVAAGEHSPRYSVNLSSQTLWQNDSGLRLVRSPPRVPAKQCRSRIGAPRPGFWSVCEVRGGWPWVRPGKLPRAKGPWMGAVDGTASRRSTSANPARYVSCIGTPNGTITAGRVEARLYSLADGQSRE